MQAIDKRAAEIDLKAVIAAGTLRNPGGRVGKRWIGLDCCWVINRSSADTGWAGGVGAGDESGLVQVFREDLVVAVGADISHRQGGIARHLLLDFESPRKDGRGLDVGLDVGRGDGCCGRSRIGNRGAGIGKCRIERRRLVEAVVQIVEQRIVNAKARADAGVAVAERVPGQADTRLGQKLRTVDGKSRVAHGWVRMDDAVREAVVGGATVLLVPAGGRFGAEACAQFESGSGPPCVFDIGRSEPGAPVQPGGCRDDGERFDVALKERRERSEGGLPQLILRKIVVRIKPLHPAPRFDGVAAEGQVDVVVEGVEIAGDGIVGADVGARSCNLRSSVRGSGAGDHDGPYRATGVEARDGRPAQWGRRSKKIEGGSGVAKTQSVEQARGENVLLLDAGNLFAQGFVDQGERVLSRRMCGRIVHRVNGEEEVVGRDVGVETSGAECLANMLRGIGEGSCNTGRKSGRRVQKLRSVGNGPESEQRSDRRIHADVLEYPRRVRNEALAGIVVGDECDVCET